MDQDMRGKKGYRLYSEEYTYNRKGHSCNRSTYDIPIKSDEQLHGDVVDGATVSNGEPLKFPVKFLPNWSNENGKNYTMAFYKSHIIANDESNADQSRKQYFDGHPLDPQRKIPLSHLRKIARRVDALEENFLGHIPFEIEKMYSYVCSRRGCNYHPATPGHSVFSDHRSLAKHFRWNCKGVQVQNDPHWPVIISAPTHSGPKHKHDFLIPGVCEGNGVPCFPQGREDLHPTPVMARTISGFRFEGYKRRTKNEIQNLEILKKKVFNQTFNDDIDIRLLPKYWMPPTRCATSEYTYNPNFQTYTTSPNDPIIPRDSSILQSSSSRRTSPRVTLSLQSIIDDTIASPNQTIPSGQANLETSGEALLDDTLETPNISPLLNVGEDNSREGIVNCTPGPSGNVSFDLDGSFVTTLTNTVVDFYNVYS